MLRKMTAWCALGLALFAASYAEAQQQKNSLTWGFSTDIETLDPYGTSKRSIQLVSRNVLEHLLYRDPKSGEPKPALATAWKWIDDKTLEFALRHGVTFHDGQGFDADDVVYTLQYIKKPDAQIAFGQADYGFINRAEKRDSFTVRLILNAPTPSAIDRLTQTLFILPHVAHAQMGAKAFGLKPIGTGPYKVTAFDAGRSLELTRYDGYYQADWGKPRLDKISVVTITDAQTQIAELTSGRVDFLWGIGADQMQQLQGAKGIVAVAGGATTISFLSLDAAGRSGTNPMQDRNVRLAIAHAINRAAISQVLRGGSSVVIDAPCHPKQFGCPTASVVYDYDVAKAKELMKASAYPNGFDTSIGAFTDSGPVAEAIIGDLREIGIKAKLDFRETSAWIKDFFGGKLQASVVPWPSNGVYDVSALVPLFFMGDQGDYTRDEEVISWFRQAGSITDAAERARLYKQGFDKIEREEYVVPLMTGVTNYGYRAELDFTAPSDGYPLIYMTGWRQ
ncbi:MAG: ABC transporter substrate-binding protein [Hyphomicrobiales bacterium]